MPKPEVKTIWAHDNENQLNTLSQGYVLTGPSIGQGSTAITRVGNKIKALGIHLKGCLNNNSGSETFVRCLVVSHDYRADPTNNIFMTTSANTSGALSSVNGLDQMYYPINTTDFKVLWDKRWKLGGNATNSAGSSVAYFSKLIKFGGKTVTYHSTSSGQGFQDWFYSIIWMAADANDDTTTGTVVEQSTLNRFFFVDP